MNSQVTANSMAESSKFESNQFDPFDNNLFSTNVTEQYSNQDQQIGQSSINYNSSNLDLLSSLASPTNSAPPLLPNTVPQGFSTVHQVA